MKKTKVLFSWSSGKDSAYCLHQLLQNPSIDVVGLFTSINEKYQRVAMHGVRRELLELQAQRLNLPLHIIELPDGCSNERYEQLFTDFIENIKTQSIEAVAFGDIFLADVRAYRERQFAGSGLEILFPIWQQGSTDELSQAIVDVGIEAYLTCIDSDKMPSQCLGQRYDTALLDAQEQAIDPCGENGEFHTFVANAPMFSAPIELLIGERVEKGRFHFIDLLPVS